MIFLAKLDLVLNVNYFLIGILYKLMHYFYWYFINGEKNSYFIFQLVLLFNRYRTPTLYDEKYFALIYVYIFNIGINNFKLVLFSNWYSYYKMNKVFT